MANAVTNKILLQHIQGMKYDLEQQIKTAKSDLEGKIGGLDKKVTNLELTMHEGFTHTHERLDRLQDDLYVKISLQAEHEKKLARL